ncbi:MAG: 5-oxoprolinase subunit PxpA [Chloroflexota bacterium]|mgnify:CR=1 FL=1
MREIDLNSDLGEGAGTDEAIMPFVTSANIACGAHAGDEETMRATVELALRRGVAIGAHPGYRDPANFGRVVVEMPHEALVEDLRAQIEALRWIAADLGAPLTHVKPHGALYNRGERDPDTAGAIVAAVRAVDLVLVAPPDSAMHVAAVLGVCAVAREGFADRAYESDGTLRSRRLPGAVHTDPRVAAAQALSFALDGGVRAVDGTFLALELDTLCIHGDTPNAVAIANTTRSASTRWRASLGSGSGSRRAKSSARWAAAAT